MKSLVKFLALAALMTASLSAFAQVGLRLGAPQNAGSGCPLGSVAAVISPDETQLSLLFDSYQVEAGPASGRTIDRKNCTIGIPVQVPGGYSLSIVKVIYRGFVGLPNRGASARFTADYSFANTIGPRFQRQFDGAQSTDYVISNDLAVTAMTWSACGASTNLRINTSMMLQNTSGLDAIASVDSADLSSGIIYQLKLRPCR